MASPNLARFLSDFTLGFSDGLTVPFALTAGLSSLGRSETVIYAGLAELCAGCISMGIGGYLAARDASRENLQRASSESEKEEEEEVGMLLAERRSEEGVDEHGSEKASARETDSGTEGDLLLRRYLQPLGLPDSTVATVLEAVRSQPGGSGWASERIRSSQSALLSVVHGGRAETPVSNDHSNASSSSSSPPPSWMPPIFSGLSVSLGYLCGGLLPLLPYFAASSVGQGLRWSIGVCLVALLVFGAVKSWVLGSRRGSWRGCLWEGIQMALFGSCAAGAAVICVNLVNQRVS